MDDTLYPEEDYVFSGYRAVSDAVNKKFGLGIYDDLVDLFHQGNHSQAFELALRKQGKAVTESYLRSLVQVYREHEPTIHPFPEVLGILESLKVQYRLGLISDGYQTVQEKKLQGLNIRHNFETIVLSDKWGKEYWKPHPWPFEKCARDLALKTSAMVYVGDNPAKDFIGARGLGIPTVRVKRPRTLHYLVDPAPGFESDHEINDLSELAPWLCQLEDDPTSTK